MAGVELSLDKAAQFFGVTTQSIRDWMRAGMPGEKVGLKWSINSAAASKWLRDRERDQALGDVERIDEHEAKKRKLVAEAGREELKLSIELGTVIPIAEYEASLAAMIGAARAKLLGIPSKVGPLVATLTPVEARDLLQTEIAEVLQELSGFDGSEAIAAVAGEPASGEPAFGEDLVASAESDD